ncbi:MAG: hypothetical protein WC624_01545 [Candidatus Margulisiibacteriota bacterium]
MNVNYTRIQLGYLPPTYNGFRFGKKGPNPIPVIIGARETQGKDQSAFELPPDDMAGLDILLHLARPFPQWAIIPAVIDGGTVNTTGNMIPNSIKMAARKLGEKYFHQIVEQYGAGLFLSDLEKDDEWIDGAKGSDLGRSEINPMRWFQFGIPQGKVYLINLFEKNGDERTSEAIAETMIKLSGQNLS